MAGFLKKPKLRRLTEKWYQLQGDLVFHFTLNEAMAGYKPMLRDLVKKGIAPDETIYVVVPKGFVTDLASVPKRLQFIFPPDGEYTYAAIVHDMAYQSLKERTSIDTSSHRYHPIHELNKHHTRYLADRLFLMGMRELGVDLFTRTAMYNAVRLGGSSSYGGIPMDEDYGLAIRNRLLMADSYLIYREKPSVGVEPSLYDDGCAGDGVAVFVKHPNLKRAFAF